ncbi:DUF6879 family protein [Nocardia sp. NPDC051570]|uniref:DUF6879 family protein n=1 Tax=Nocardia sp. NPDC051570 TaxID=3364324 RepID=UPI0037ADFD63
MLLRQNDEPDLWPTLFRELRHSAFHLEVQDVYHVPSEDERLQKFLRGEPAPFTAVPWHDLIRETVARGVSIGRVRVITVPHSDYQRWLLSVTRYNQEAGEDIRYVPRHLAEQVPPDDWWLMDDERVAYNLVDGSGGPAGIAVTSDPRVVGYCREVRERLWKLAIPYEEYARR